MAQDPTAYDEEAPPLAGVKVVDLTQYEAGPSATQILAWLGADVIKVEPPGGEPARYLLGGDASRDSIIFLLFNQSKRSIIIDLATDNGRRELHQLLSDADILAENFAPGTLERLGLPPIEALMRELPGLIVASIRGYASGGPWSTYKSLDFVGQAVGGAMSVTGQPDGPPTRVGVTIADSGAGLHLVAGILAALYRRTRTGRGGRVEVSLQDAVVNLMRNALAPTYVNGDAAPRTGSAYITSAPSDLYPCYPGGPNDYIYFLLASKQHWGALMHTIGRQELIDDPRFSRQSSRNARAKELYAIVREWTERHHKLDAMAQLSAVGVPCGAVLDTAELLENEHLRACKMVIDHRHAQWGELRIPGCPIRISGFAPRIEPAPAAGQHSEEIRKSIRR